MSPCSSAHPWPPPWPFLVTAPDTAGVLMSFTTNVAAEEDQRKISSSFALSCFHKRVLRHQVRHVDHSGWFRAYCSFACSASRFVSPSYPSCSSRPSTHSPPRRARQLGANVARTTPRTLYAKRNDILHNVAVNYPRDCLPREPIVLRRSSSTPYIPTRSRIPKMYPRLRLRRVKEGLFAGSALSQCMILIPHL
jgi:hypothetical protein